MTAQPLPEDYDVDIEWVYPEVEEHLYQVSRQPKAYMTVMTKPVSRLDIEVNKAMNNGWELYGDPYVSQSGEFAQAMVKYYVDTKEN